MTAKSGPLASRDCYGLVKGWIQIKDPIIVDLSCCGGCFRLVGYCCGGCGAIVLVVGSCGGICVILLVNVVEEVSDGSLLF